MREQITGLDARAYFVEGFARDSFEIVPGE
jgi:hypothetical protein